MATWSLELAGYRPKAVSDDWHEQIFMSMPGQKFLNAFKET
jgi:hypothetical protein